MKKICLLTLLLTLTLSCGFVESWYDGAQYESLTNEKVNIVFISGGQIIKTYDNAKVIYTNSDSQAMWIKHKKKTWYLQGDLIVEVLD